MIALACDHGGFQLKTAICKHLEGQGIQCRDFGCYDTKSCDYPDFARPAAEAVASGECSEGIFVCTTGIGISMVANKVKGVRAAVCTELITTRLTREHNNANVLALGQGVVGEKLALEMVDVFLKTPFSNGENHKRRLEKMAEME